jgi:hypothetical protein
MVDKGIKKITILKKDLPPVNSSNKHVLRYRIISDDFNRTSAWSKIYYVDSVPLNGLTAETTKNAVTVSPTAGTISIRTVDSRGRGKLDIFIKYGSDSYSYHGTTNQTTLSGDTATTTYTFANTATTATTLRIAVQPEGITKERITALTLHESSVISIP